MGFRWRGFSFGSGSGRAQREARDEAYRKAVTLLQQGEPRPLTPREAFDFFPSFAKAQRRADKLPDQTRYWIKEQGKPVFTGLAAPPPPRRPKARIRQNVWGNWYGYLGSERVIAFGNGPQESAEQAAQRWLQEHS